MKKFKKALALLLSMLILLTVSPISAFAEETTPEAEWFTSYNVKKGEGTLAEAVQLVGNGGRIDLLKDIPELGATAVLNKNVTINGNGYTITRGATFGGAMFIVGNGAKINVTKIILDGNADNVPGYANSVFVVTDGYLTLEDGAVIRKNNAGSNNGGAIRAGSSIAGIANPCVVTMNAGSELADCSADNGGAVYLGSGAEFILNDGAIKNCNAGYHGGAVIVDDTTASFVMNGGSITGCSCSTKASGYVGSAVYANKGTTAIKAGSITDNANGSDFGAVYVSVSADVSIGGTAYIYDNDGTANQSNIFVDDNAVIAVNPAFAEGAKIGVSRSQLMQEGDTVDMSFISSAEDVMGYLFNDYDGSTFYTADGAVTLIQCIKVTFNPGNGSCPVGEKIYGVNMAFGELPECDYRDGFEFLGWYTEDDVLVTKTTVVSGNEDITLYAKWENLNKLDDSPLSFIGRFFERIGELMRSVFEFLENLFAGTGNDELEKIEK
ncbi:MAG: InlB B-repeat-containing protein [Clostridia bacterium]|nr:InlB B-repeat-containing protein [Clostridia bacterium]